MGATVKPKTIYITLAVIGLILTAHFLLNPLGTATLDPRARIAGVMPMRQSSDSMAPTLWTGDIIMVSAWAYARKDPAPGDIAIFNYPKDRSSDWCKRVIAAGGSTVEIMDGVTRVDGEIFPEPWKDDAPYVEEFSLNMKAVTVPEGQYFVMGDNRDNSMDSRHWGFVPRDHFVGRVEL
jgi:signal peptidase I